MSTFNPIRVDIISDVVCPWCLVGYRQLVIAADNSGQGVEFFWHPFELNPNMPAEGQNLAEHISEKYGSTVEDSQRTRDHLVELGNALDVAFSFSQDTRIYNTFQAHQLIHWASLAGRAHDAKLALFHAYFTDQRDISSVDTLLSIVSELELDLKSAEAALKQHTFAQAVREKEYFWTSRGVSGVPTMIFDRQHLVTGAQGVENYTSILTRIGTSTKPG